ncbi:hypothetical protein CYMTET_25350, partial [Cymbomonas tetramitiformis]
MDQSSSGDLDAGEDWRAHVTSGERQTVANDVLEGIKLVTQNADVDALVRSAQQLEERAFLESSTKEHYLSITSRCLKILQARRAGASGPSSRAQTARLPNTRGSNPPKSTQAHDKPYFTSTFQQNLQIHSPASNTAGESQHSRSRAADGASRAAVGAANLTSSLQAEAPRESSSTSLLEENRALRAQVKALTQDLQRLHRDAAIKPLQSAELSDAQEGALDKHQSEYSIEAETWSAEHFPQLSEPETQLERVRLYGLPLPDVFLRRGVSLAWYRSYIRGKTTWSPKHDLALVFQRFNNLEQVSHSLYEPIRVSNWTRHLNHYLQKLSLGAFGKVPLADDEELQQLCHNETQEIIDNMRQLGLHLEVLEDKKAGTLVVKIGAPRKILEKFATSLKIRVPCSRTTYISCDSCGKVDCGPTRYKFKKEGVSVRYDCCPKCYEKRVFPSWASRFDFYEVQKDLPKSVHQMYVPFSKELFEDESLQ